MKLGEPLLGNAGAVLGGEEFAAGLLRSLLGCLQIADCRGALRLYFLHLVTQREVGEIELVEPAQQMTRRVGEFAA